MVRQRANPMLGLAVALPVAAVLGVQLGQSAIAEINPIHFQGTAPPPRGIDPSALAPAPATGFADAYGWDRGRAARAADCGDHCAGTAVREVRIFSDPLPAARRVSGPYWRDSTATTEPPPWDPGDVGARRLSVERYMHYPIEEGREEEVAKPPSSAAEEEEEEAEPGGEE